MADITKQEFEYLDLAGLSLYDQKIKALIKAIDDKVGDISGLTSETITSLAAALSSELDRAVKAEMELNEKIDNIKVVPSQLDTEFELVKDSKIAFKLDDSQNDLRILVPSNAAFEQQQTGDGATTGVYYVGLRCWAPSMDARSCHKGSSEAELATTDAIQFDSETGRPYADMWLPVAREENGVWTSYVANQPDGRYPGWNFEIHWLDINGNEIAFKARRVSITNEKNFLTHKDWYIGGIESNVTTLKEAVALLQGDGEGSVKAIVASAVAKIVDEADERFDTLKEIANWILSDETNTLDILTRLSALESVTYRPITADEINALFADSTAPIV